MIGSSDSDSEDDKRVIRSAKDRRFDELQATCHEIRVSYRLSYQLSAAMVHLLSIAVPANGQSCSRHHTQLFMVQCSL